jgi:UDP-N-acetylmuramate dehydrogenase
MLAMNAGVKEYEIFNILHSVKINGQGVLAEDIEHGYRFAKLGGIATHARFKIHHGFDQRLLDQLLSLRTNQPYEPSAGSAFKNPDGDYAGRLIEAAGLKGKKEGQMQWSTMHANFLVNLGGGTYQEAKSLIDLAKNEVKNRFGITLIEEIKIL